MLCSFTYSEAKAKSSCFCEKKRRGYGTCQDVERPTELKNCVVAVILYVNSNLFSLKNCLNYTMPDPAFRNQISFKDFDFLCLTH